MRGSGGLVAAVAAAIQLGAIDCAKRSASEASSGDASSPQSPLVRVDLDAGGDSSIARREAGDTAGVVDDGTSDASDAARTVTHAIGIGSVIGLPRNNPNCGAPARFSNAAPPPPAEGVIARAVVTSGAVENLDAALARARGSLRTCYLKALESNPAESGTVTLALSVSAAGDVGASVGATDGLSAGTAACAAAVLHRLGLPRSPAPATVDVKIAFRLK